MRLLLLHLVLLSGPSVLVEDDASEQAHRLVERLASEKIDDREEAALKLRELGKAALPALEKAAAHDDAEVASRARGLLRRISIQDRVTDRLLRSIPEAEHLLTSHDPHGWTEVFLEATAVRGGTRAHPELRVEDVDGLGGPAVRAAKTIQEKRSVCLAIRRWKLRTSAPELTGFLSADDSYTRGMAALSLGELGVRESVTAIVPLLGDKDGQVRQLAVRGLYAIADVRATSSILPSLRDADSPCRSWAAAILARIGAKETTGEILKLLADTSDPVRRSSALALTKLGSTELGPALIGLLGPQHPRDVRAGSASMLGQLGIQEALPWIRKLLEDREFSVRGAAASALGDLGDKESRVSLEGLLDDGAITVRSRVVRALWRIGVPEAIPTLNRLLADEYREIRVSAAEGLCHLGSREGVPTLLQDWRNLVFLNALRQPKLWHALGKEKFTTDGNALKSEYTELLAKEAGRPLEGAKELTDREEGYLLWAGRADPLRMDPSWRRVTIVEGLEMVASPNGSFVLEADRIRILSPDDALNFWTAWWEQERRNRK
ncbi:MAG TPA: HEAT repeat domain-containing protein [Planctomycetota bacterium]|nr:HEAT repeat domain-containing protein [Planctomycetota bacterium]